MARTFEEFVRAPVLKRAGEKRWIFDIVELTWACVVLGWKLQVLEDAGVRNHPQQQRRNEPRVVFIFGIARADEHYDEKEDGVLI